MLGCGSAGKFYFLSLLVNQLARWIRCVLHGNNKVHRANEALKKLGFAFLSYLEQGAHSLSVFFTTAADLLQVTIVFVLKIFPSLIKRKYEMFSTGIVGMQHAAAQEWAINLARGSLRKDRI